jgi:death-on-curing protein
MADTNHAELVRSFGGTHGIRDEGLIESALARPRNLFAYNRTADLADLTAAYGFGVAKNHGYADSNKRTAFLVMVIFVGLNGFRLIAAEAEVVALMIGVADDTIGENALAEWVRTHAQATSSTTRLSLTTRG